jgi:hypothetical protein
VLGSQFPYERTDGITAGGVFALDKYIGYNAPFFNSAATTYNPMGSV